MAKEFINLVDPKDEDMAGANELERALNKYLTCQFVWCGSPIPDDECLHEAKAVIQKVREHDEKHKHKSGDDQETSS